MYVISIVLGVVQFLLIGYILIQEVKIKSAAVFLWATLMIMFGLPHLLTSFLQDMSYPVHIIAQASLFVIGFCLIYVVCRSKKRVPFLTLTNKKRLEITLTKIPGTFFEYLCLIVFLISIVGYVFFVVRSQGGLFNTSWASTREIETDYVSFAGLASILIFTFSGLSLYYFFTNRKFKAVIILLLFLGLVIVTRNRVQILPVLIFFISLYLIKIQKISIKHVIIGVFLAIVVIYIVYAIRAFRYLGTFSDALSQFSWEYLNTTVRSFLNSNDGELGLRQYFYYFIERNNEFEGFNRGYTYIRMLFVYIPSRWSFGLKPQSFDLYMGEAIGMAPGGSMHPTLFGDCFGNLFWFGILLGGVWALLANGNDLLIRKQKDDFFKILLFFLASYAFVVIGRGSVYNGFVVFAWGALMVLILKFFSPLFIKIRFTI